MSKDVCKDRTTLVKVERDNIVTYMTDKFAKPPFQDSAIYFDLRVYVHLNNHIVHECP